MFHQHTDNEFLIYLIKSVGKTMKTNIGLVDCFALFGAHSHNIIVQIHS